MFWPASIFKEDLGSLKQKDQMAPVSFVCLRCMFAVVPPRWRKLLSVWCILVILYRHNNVFRTYWKGESDKAGVTMQYSLEFAKATTGQRYSKVLHWTSNLSRNTAFNQVCNSTLTVCVCVPVFLSFILSELIEILPLNFSAVSLCCTTRRASQTHTHT